MAEPKDKPYLIRVYIESVSPDPEADGQVRNQKHILEEGSFTAEEHVFKNFQIDEAVYTAVREKLYELAGQYLKGRK